VAPLIPFHDRFRADKQGLRKKAIAIYPCMVRPPETLIVWPVM